MITLKGGDFGAEGQFTYGEENMYLPDPQRPGMIEAVLLADVDEVERIADDRSGQLKAAVNLSVRGLVTAGPVGLAAGLLAVRKPKDVVFSVRLADGRALTAMADAATYAHFHTAQVAARSAALRNAGPDPADEVIAKYLRGRATEPAPTASANSSPAEQRVTDASSPSRPLARAPIARPVFGRRGG